MGTSFIQGKVFDADSLDDINTISANCGINIGNLPSRLIEVFKEYLPDATLNWDVGCRHFWINGVKYGLVLDYYWTYNAPKFYKTR